MVLIDKLGEIIDLGMISWIRDKTMLIYLAIIFLITLISGIVINFFIAGLLANFSQTAQTITSPTQIFAMIMPLISVSTIIGTITGLITLAVSYLVIKRTLELNGSNGEKLTLLRYILLIVLGIAGGIVAVLSLYRIKWLAVGIIGFILTIVGLMLLGIGTFMGAGIILVGGLLVFIGVIMLIAYAIVVIINGIRLTLGQVAFVEKERGIMESLKISWETTKGEVLGIILAFIIVAIIIWRNLLAFYSTHITHFYK